MPIESSSTSTTRWRRYVKDLLPVSGDFTPALKFGGSSTGITGTQVGYYTKIGKIVHFKLFLGLTNKGAQTGEATIGGLPFIVSEDLAGASNEGGCYSVYNTNMTGLTSAVVGFTAASDSEIHLRDQGATGTADLTDANFNNGSNLRLVGSYYTDE